MQSFAKIAVRLDRRDNMPETLTAPPPRVIKETSKDNGQLLPLDDPSLYFNRELSW